MESASSDGEEERKPSEVRLLVNLVNQQMEVSQRREERVTQQIEASQQREERVIALLERMCAASAQLPSPGAGSGGDPDPAPVPAPDAAPGALAGPAPAPPPGAAGPAPAAGSVQGPRSLTAQLSGDCGYRQRPLLLHGWSHLHR